MSGYLDGPPIETPTTRHYLRLAIEGRYVTAKHRVLGEQIRACEHRAAIRRAMAPRRRAILASHHTA